MVVSRMVARYFAFLCYSFVEAVLYKLLNITLWIRRSKYREEIIRSRFLPMRSTWKKATERTAATARYAVLHIVDSYDVNLLVSLKHVEHQSNISALALGNLSFYGVYSIERVILICTYLYRTVSHVYGVIRYICTLCTYHFTVVPTYRYLGRYLSGRQVYLHTYMYYM